MLEMATADRMKADKILITATTQAPLSTTLKENIPKTIPVSTLSKDTTAKSESMNFS